MKREAKERRGGRGTRKEWAQSSSLIIYYVDCVMSFLRQTFGASLISCRVLFFTNCELIEHVITHGVVETLSH